MKTTLTTSVLTAVSLLAPMHSSSGEDLFPTEGPRAPTSLGVDASPSLPAPAAQVFGNGRWVAIGSDGKLCWSTDGIEWRPAHLPVEKFLRGVAFGNDRFVAVGGSYLGGGPVILASINGRSWHRERCPYKQVLHGVTYFGDRFIAVGAKGTILTSTSGRCWLQQSSGTDATLATIACGNGICVIGGDGGLLLSSRDALSWVRQISGTGCYIGEIAFDHGGFVATAGNLRFASSDGSRWWAIDIGPVPRTLVGPHQ